MQSAALKSASSAASLALHRSIPSIRSVRKAFDPSVTVGFVPTMGALHEGHLSLVRQARENNDVVIASIFVNPTQFGVNEDFSKYPRQLEQDMDALSDLGVDHLFAPDKDAMYRNNHVTFVDPKGFDNNTSEGRSRPGHFQGVATIVTKLLNIVNPTNAYFGQKDATQCCLIKRIVDDLDIPTNIVIGETVRENDGLAMSSRNAYLSPEERFAAPILYKSLCAARNKTMVVKNNNNHINDNNDMVSSQLIKDTVLSVLQTESLVKEVQYISVDDILTMQPIDYVPATTTTDISHNNNGSAVLSIAVKIGSVRLIDNIVL